MSDPRRLLRNALRANALFSGASGVVFATRAASLAEAAGLPDARVLLGVGVGLLGFAAWLAYVASRPAPSAATAMQIVWADLAWVLGTLPLVAFGPLTPTGTVAAIALADVVALLAFLQYLGVRRMQGGEAAAKRA